MTNNEFTKYIDELIAKLEQQLIEITLTIKNYSSKVKIKLPTGDELTNLQRNYIINHRLTIIERLFGISKNDLQQYQRKILLGQLKKTEKEIESILRELKSIQKDNDEITKMPNSNRNILLAVLDYSIEYQVSPKDTLSFLISLFRLEKVGEPSLISTLEKDLLLYFDEQGNFDPKNTKTIIFILVKLFNIIIPEDNKKYEQIITSIINEINSSIEISAENKENLLNQKDAINKLKEYISNDRIIKICVNLSYFTDLLQKSGINEEQIKAYTKEMNHLIASKEENDENNLAKIHLFEEEYQTLISAKKILSKLEISEQQELIKRLIKDVISLCRYIDMGLESTELVEMREALSTKIHLLAESLRMIKHPVEETSAFGYVVLEDGIPNIIRSLETMDPTNYIDVYNRLISLYKSASEEPTFSIEEIPFYLATAREITIIYTIINNHKILITATYTKDIHRIMEEIPPSIINNIKSMQTDEKDPTIMQNYENLLIKLLDLDNINHNKTLKK